MTIRGLTRELIEPLARSGLGCNEIARRMTKLLGRPINECRIRKRLLQWGVPQGYSRCWPTDADLALLVQLSDGTRTAREITAIMQARRGKPFTIQSVQRWQRRLKAGRAPRHAVGFRGVRGLGPESPRGDAYAFVPDLDRAVDIEGDEREAA